MKDKDVLELIVNITQNATKCEENKERLNDHPKFEPYALFTRIDREDKGFITKMDLINFLIDNQIAIPLNRSTVDLFIEYYDRDFDGHLSFSEFLNFILNKEHNLIRSIATQRETYKLCNDEYLEKDLEAYTSELILSEFFLFEYANMKKMDMFNRHNSIEALNDLLRVFKDIDGNKDGTLSIEDFEKYLIEKRIEICNGELMSFVSLFDEDLDGELNWNEFLFLMLPSPRNFKYDTKELRNIEAQYKKYYGNKGRDKEDNDNDDVYNDNNQQYCKPNQMRINEISNYNSNNDYNDQYNNNNNNEDSIFKGQLDTKQINNKPSKQSNQSKELKPNISQSFATLSNLLIEIIDFETQIDDLRLQLYNDPNFNLKSLFSFFDIYSNQYISLMDFQESLEQFEVINKNSILLFGKYDHSNTGRLSLSNFSELFTPQGEKYALNPNDRSKGNNKEQGKDFDISTKGHITELLNLMINYESFLSLLPKWYEKNKGDVFYAFDQLDVNSNGFINEEEFNQLFMGKIQESDLLFLMEKIDSDKDGHITLEDIITIFK